jgi:HlyD family secretion protein
VKKGQALFYLDSSDLQKEIKDATQELEEAELQLEKSIAQAPIDYNKKLKTLEDSKEDLEDAYDDAYTTVSNAFLNLPSVMTTAENILYGTDLSKDKSQWNVNVYRDLFTLQNDKDNVQLFGDIAIKDYKTAREAYDKSLADFKKLTLYSSNEDIEKVLKETSDASIAITQALKSEKNLVDTVIDMAEQKKMDLNSYVSSAQSSLSSKIGTANTQMSSLSSQEKTIKNLIDTISDTEQEIELYKINNESGNNPLDLQSEKNSVAKKRENLADLKADLADYVVYAPFNGIVAKVDAEKGDSASSGTSLATLITKTQIAEITLNENDIAKVKVGQSATITFDALENLIVSGKVQEVDMLGTASQGVVSYTVKIALDTQDDRIKSGMSVSVSIITDMKSDVVLVSNSLIKSLGDTYYVETLAEGTYDASLVGTGTGVSATGIRTTQIPIEIGITDDTNTEITSGLEEGDVIITKTIMGTTKTTSTSTTKSTSGNSEKSILSTMGGGGGMMGGGTPPSR